YLPVVGIPYLHGVVGEFGLNLGKAGPTGRISGFYLSASVPEYDLLGDKAPQIEASGGFKNTDFGLALGMGLYLQIIATVYGISIGVKGDVGLQAVLAVKDPSFSSDMTWDEDQDLTGMLDINVPMEFRIEPTAAWGVVAGISKLTVGIPGTGDKWRGEPFLAEALDPLEFSFPWEALMGTMSSETADLDHLGDGPNIQAIKAGATDNNPKLAEMIEFIIMATDCLGEAVGELDAFLEGTTEFWATAASEGIEAAQRNQHWVERMMNENIQHDKNIRTYHTNLQVLLSMGPSRVDKKEYTRWLELLHKELVSARVNMDTLNGKFMVELDPKKYEDYKKAETAVIKRQKLLITGGKS
ncbi:MAG: hypothetical protein JRI25_15635, partial [Deltaproteobacteria bacterium]|nr:hypothetical protein [Deltaproteobacteria bacterium]